MRARYVFATSIASVLLLALLTARPVRADLSNTAFIGFCMWGEETSASGQPVSHHADTLANCAKAKCGVTGDNPQGLAACSLIGNNNTVGNCVKLTKSTFNIACTCTESNAQGQCTNPWIGWNALVQGGLKFGIITFRAGFSVQVKKKYRIAGDRCDYETIPPPHPAGSGSWVFKDATVYSTVKIDADLEITVDLGIGGNDTKVKLSCENQGNPKRVMQSSSFSCPES